MKRIRFPFRYHLSGSRQFFQRSFPAKILSPALHKLPVLDSFHAAGKERQSVQFRLAMVGQSSTLTMLKLHVAVFSARLHPALSK